MSNYLVFGKIVNLLWQNFYSFEQIFISLKSQILKNNIAIWSHCELQCEVSLTRRDNAGRKHTHQVVMELCGCYGTMWLLWNYVKTAAQEIDS